MGNKYQVLEHSLCFKCDNCNTKHSAYIRSPIFLSRSTWIDILHYRISLVLCILLACWVFFPLALISSVERSTLFSHWCIQWVKSICMWIGIETCWEQKGCCFFFQTKRIGLAFFNFATLFHIRFKFAWIEFMVFKNL